MLCKHQVTSNYAVDCQFSSHVPAHRHRKIGPCSLQEETRVPSDGPAIVHCSAGIGRTGTFCTIDIVLRRLRMLGPDATPEEVAWAVDIPQACCADFDAQ